MKSILIAALVAAAPAEQARRPCLTEAEVENLALFALPPLLDAAAAACGPALPADAYLTNGGQALARSLAAQSPERWASASAALVTIAKDKFPASLSEATARGMIKDLATEGLKGKEPQAQCVRINRMADLLSPLPPRNLAGIVVLAVGLASDSGGKAEGKKANGPPLLCPATRP